MDKENLLQVAVCDDNPKDLAALDGLIKKSGIAAKRHTFSSGEDFLAAFRAGRYDLIFMDIYMKGMRGIETVAAIRKADENVVIAFVTTSPDFKAESYSLDAMKYIEKPVTEKAVLSTLELARSIRQSRPTISISEAGGEVTAVYLNSIIYIEQRNHVLEIHTAERVITTSQSVKMNEIEKRLPKPPFTRCHRSYIVNLDHVQTAKMEGYCFYMKNGDRADIRRGGFTHHHTEWQNRCLDKTGEE